MFAKVDVAPGTVVSFYHGIHLSHSEVDLRGWELNQNTIALDDDIVIDVCWGTMRALAIAALYYNATSIRLFQVYDF